MSKPYPSFILFLGELRRSLKTLGGAVLVATVALFFLSSRVVTLLQEHLGENLYFFSVAGPFLAHVRVAFFAALFLLMPLCMHVLWRALGKPFGLTPGQLRGFVVATCLLFYGGTAFCALVTLPFGIKFLLGF